MAETGLFLVFPFLMVYAACSDLFTMTISNAISAALVIGFVALALLVGMPWSEIGWHLACGAGILALTFTMFALGWIGGGDAKLAAATVVWLGFDRLLDFGVTSAALGGLLTLGLLAARSRPLPAFLMQSSWIARLHDEKTGVPYGIALAAAGLLLYPETSVWMRAAVGA